MSSLVPNGDSGGGCFEYSERIEVRHRYECANGEIRKSAKQVLIRTVTNSCGGSGTVIGNQDASGGSTAIKLRKLNII